MEVCMKRILIFSLCTLFWLSAAKEARVYAMTSEERETMIDNVLEDKNEEKAQYMSELERVLSNVVSAQSDQTEQNTVSLQRTGDTLLNYDIAGAYQVYILDTLLVTALKDTGSFASAISDTVQWKVPVTTADGVSGMVVLLEKDGVLEYVGTSVGEAVETWFVTDEQIRNAVTLADEVTGGINSMQIAHSYLYNTTFVYLIAEDEEYLIPFSYYAERIELENGKLYTVSEITDIFDMYFDELQLIDSPNNNGGVPFRTRILISTGQDESRQAVLPVETAAAVIAASLAGIFVLTYYIKKSGEKRKGS